MHKMMLELSNTSVGLNNMTNKLLALQNSQFVENRVQEDDDCQAAPRKPELKNEETQKEVNSSVLMSFPISLFLLNCSS